MLGPPPHVVKLNEGTQGAGVILAEAPHQSDAVELVVNAGALSTGDRRAIAKLIEAARLLTSGTDFVVVCDGTGVLRGVVTKTDVVKQISVCQGATCQCPVSTVMTRDVVLCRGSDQLQDVSERMKARHRIVGEAAAMQLHARVSDDGVEGHRGRTVHDGGKHGRRPTRRARRPAWISPP